MNRVSRLPRMVLLVACLGVTQGYAEGSKETVAPPPRDQVEQIRIAKAVEGASRHWKTMCHLMAAVARPEQHGAFFTAHPRLSETYVSLDAFSRCLRRWQDRAVLLPDEITKLDLKRNHLEYLESPYGQSVVIHLREPGTERLLRVKGVFDGDDLVEVNILPGYIRYPGAPSKP